MYSKYARTYHVNIPKGYRGDILSSRGWVSSTSEGSSSILSHALSKFCSTFSSQSREETVNSDSSRSNMLEPVRGWGRKFVAKVRQFKPSRQSTGNSARSRRLNRSNLQGYPSTQGSLVSGFVNTDTSPGDPFSGPTGHMLRPSNEERSPIPSIQ